MGRFRGLGHLFGWRSAEKGKSVFARDRAATGIEITPQRAMQITTVLACVNVIATDVGTVPLYLYRRLPNGDRERVEDHPLVELLEEPNPWMTGNELRTTLLSHTLLRGNGPAALTTGSDGRMELWPLSPETRVERKGRELYYSGRLPFEDSQRVLLADEVMMLRGLSLDGIRGVSVVEYACNAFGLTAAAEEFAARSFRNGFGGTRTLTAPPGMKPEQVREERKKLREEYAGVDNAGKTMFLQNGMKLEVVGVSNEDAQLLEARRFQRSEIAGLFRVPPHKIGDLDKATFSNIEQQALEYVANLRPWGVRIEKAMMRALLTREERRTLYLEHLWDVLVQTDIKTRYDAYASALNNGHASINEVRRKDNKNGIGPLGDVYRAQGAVLPLTAGADAEATEEDLSAPAVEDAAA